MEFDRIETEHLVGTRIQQDDLGVLYRMFTNEEVMYTLGGTRTFRETQEIHKNMMDHWEKFGYGIYIFRDKNTDEFVGRGGLKKVSLEGKDEIEAIYALMPTYWGKGYAHEMAKKSIEVGFEHNSISDVVAFTLTENKKSLRACHSLTYLR